MTRHINSRRAARLGAAVFAVLVVAAACNDYPTSAVSPNLYVEPVTGYPFDADTTCSWIPPGDDGRFCVLMRRGAEALKNDPFVGSGCSCRTGTQF